MKTRIITTLVLGILMLSVQLSRAQNLLTDGDFSTTTVITPFNTPQPPTNIWCSWLNYDNGANANATVNDGVCNFQIFSAGFNTWDIQLAYWGFTLTPGHSYRLTFDVKADADRPFGVFVGEDGGGYTSFNSMFYGQVATTGWETKSIDFNVPVVYPLHKLSFEVGTSVIGISFDNIVLEDQGTFTPINLTDGSFNTPTAIVPENSFPPPMNVWCTFQNSDPVANIIANGSIVDNAFCYQVTNGGTGNWEVQLTQYGFYLNWYHNYRLSFKVKADAERTFGVFLGEYMGSWNNLLGWDRYIQNATTEWQTISLDFVTTNVFNVNKLSFEIGGSNTSMCLDDIVLQDLGVYIPPVGIIGTSVNGWADDVDMNSTDGIVYTLTDYPLTAGMMKFRQDNAWDINWGNSDFPAGIGYINGPDIPVPDFCNYDITFNRITGEYAFVNKGNCAAKIGIIGSAVPPYNNWETDVKMLTTDRINYSLRSYSFTDGEAKFRQDDSWAINWGNTTFPTGTATLNGPNIPVTGGNYNVKFNIATGEYSFAIPEIGILGSALNGWDDDINMLTTDGVTYTLSSYTFTDGEVKFRADDGWEVNWGGYNFPTGWGFQDGPNIYVPAGIYTVTFNRLTGEYNFINCLQCPDPVYAPSSPGSCGAIVYYPPVTGSSYCESEGITIIQTEGLPSGSMFPVGSTTNKFTLTTETGAVTTCSFYVYVYDAEPPAIVVPHDTITLWPPNHQMVNIPVKYTDNCGIAFSYINVWSNEPASGLGSGDKSPDWVVPDGDHLSLRAERSGNGNGREYHVYLYCYDYSYNFSSREILVRVPHDMGKTKSEDVFAGIDNTADKLGVKIWPNPATDNFNLKVESAMDTPVDLYISDLTGRLLSTVKVANENTTVFGGDLLPGIYFVKVIQGDFIQIVKIVKK